MKTTLSILMSFLSYYFEALASIPARQMCLLGSQNTVSVFFREEQQQKMRQRNRIYTHIADERIQLTGQLQVTFYTGTQFEWRVCLERAIFYGLEP